MPSRNEANDCPRLPGAAVELSSGPRVQVESKLNWPVWLLAKKELVSRYWRNSMPVLSECAPADLFTVAMNDCVSFGRSSPPMPVP